MAESRLDEQAAGIKDIQSTSTNSKVDAHFDVNFITFYCMLLFGVHFTNSESSGIVNHRILQWNGLQQLLMSLV